jgi:hypothetical protein
MMAWYIFFTFYFSSICVLIVKVCFILAAYSNILIFKIQSNNLCFLLVDLGHFHLMPLLLWLGLGLLLSICLLFFPFILCSSFPFLLLDYLSIFMIPILSTLLDYDIYIFFCLFVCGTWDWTQDHMLAKQVLHNLRHTPRESYSYNSWFCYFSDYKAVSKVNIFKLNTKEDINLILCENSVVCV